MLGYKVPSTSGHIGYVYNSLSTLHAQHGNGPTRLRGLKDNFRGYSPLFPIDAI
jgi:hypothetical protein